MQADDRLARFDWQRIEEELAADGAAVIESLLDPPECAAIATLYADDEKFRRTIVMAQYGYGKGEYKYFAYPLPAPIATLRQALYRKLAPIANGWNELLQLPARYPTEHEDFLALCHRAGQTRPTPLLLRYEAGDYNCLHQDLYGDLAFPLQVAVLLSRPGEDFSGGEFVLTEQRMRMQSRPDVIPLEQGDAVIFAVHHRPVRGKSKTIKLNMRHGVSRIRSGHRQTLGLIFHDAK